MGPILNFLLHYGYWVLFLNVLLEQMGIPIPASPVMLAMGALAGLGKFSFAGALVLAVTAAMLADQVWYRLGRVRGHSILRLICRISLEPDSCVSSTHRTFSRWGAWSLVFARFVPGLSAVAAPMAGLTRMPMRRFIAADTVGATLWCGFCLTLGYVFDNQLELVAQSMSRFGGWVVVLVAGLIAAYLGAKYYQRRRFMKQLRIHRVTPDELMRMIEAGDDVAVIDLRNSLEVEVDDVKVPGAIWIDQEDIEARHDEIPREKEVVLYCS
jgi:membrane protein DedA with SNARE-associated domain